MLAIYFDFFGRNCIDNDEYKGIDNDLGGWIGSCAS